MIIICCYRLGSLSTPQAYTDIVVLVLMVPCLGCVAALSTGEFIHFFLANNACAQIRISRLRIHAPYLAVQFRVFTDRSRKLEALHYTYLQCFFVQSSTYRHLMSQNWLFLYINFLWSYTANHEELSSEKLTGCMFNVIKPCTSQVQCYVLLLFNLSSKHKHIIILPIQLPTQIKIDYSYLVCIVSQFSIKG